SREALAAAQVGESDDPRTEALLRFAIALVERRGQASDQQFEELRQLGWSDEEIVETIGQVALNVFTNYVNISLEVPVDFPAVELRPVG
ncbi:carboxymuconolactone decarboxylase family protein, partial [Tessaracoccus lubricantis]